MVTHAHCCWMGLKLLWYQFEKNKQTDHLVMWGVLQIQSRASQTHRGHLDDIRHVWYLKSGCLHRYFSELKCKQPMWESPLSRPRCQATEKNPPALEANVSSPPVLAEERRSCFDLVFPVHPDSLNLSACVHFSLRHADLHFVYLCSPLRITCEPVSVCTALCKICSTEWMTPNCTTWRCASAVPK